MMETSILNTIKKLLGLSAEYEAFDIDIIVAINTAIMALHQLGVEQADGFTVTGPNESWDELVDSGNNLEAIKTYIYLRVRLIFDPPANGTIMNAFKEQLAEYEWRINVAVDPKTTFD